NGSWEAAGDRQAWIVVAEWRAEGRPRPAVTARLAREVSWPATGRADWGARECRAGPGKGSAPRRRKRRSFFPPACGGLLLAFADTLAVAFAAGAVSVMEPAGQQRAAAGGIGDDCVPLTEA